MFSLTSNKKDQITGAPERAAERVWLRRAGLASLLLYLPFCILALFVPGADRSYFPPYVALPVSMEEAGQLAAIGAVLVICALALFALYIYGLRRASRIQSHTAELGDAAETRSGADIARLAFVFVVGFHLLMIVFPTLFSTDLFDYVRHGRIFAVYGENPHTVPAIFFQHDPFFNLGGWVTTGSVYGPLHAYVSGGLALISGDGVGTAFIVFKSFYILVNLINVLLIWKIVARIMPGSEGKAVIFFGWNPYVVMMVAANGHNDILMLAFVLAAILCYLNRWVLLGVLSLALATLVKFVTLPLLILYIALAVRRQDGLGRRLATGAGAIGLSLAAVLVSYIPFWEGSDTFDYLSRVGNKTGYTIASLFNDAIQWGTALPRVTTVIILGLPVVAYMLWSMFRIRDLQDFIQSSAIIAFFVPLAMFWFQPWYILLALGLVALRPRGILSVAMIAFSVSVLFYDNLWWQSPIRMNTQQVVRVLVVFGPPLAVLLYGRLRNTAPETWRRLVSWSLESTDRPRGGGAAALLTNSRMALELLALCLAAAVPLAITLSSSSQLRSLIDLFLVKLRLLLPL